MATKANIIKIYAQADSAKKYGVKTGMALWQAKQLCPEITFVSPRMNLYLRFSRMALSAGC